MRFAQLTSDYTIQLFKMLSTIIINRIYILVFLLQYTHAQAPIPTQSTLAATNYPSALILKGTGLAGSVVAATGCDITYEFKCTASSTVCVEGDVVVSAHTRYYYCSFDFAQ